MLEIAGVLASIDAIISSKLFTVILLPLCIWGYNKVESWYKKRTLKSNISDIVEIDHLLQDALKKLPVNRAIVFKGHNTGSRPSPTNPMFITAINEASAPNVRALLHDVQKAPMDAEHTKIIKELILNERVTVERSKLAPDGILLPMYIANGNKHSESNILVINDKYLIYLVLLFTEDAPNIGDLTAEQRNYINVLVNKIKHLMGE